jgi:hypothetical protein
VTRLPRCGDMTASQTVKIIFVPVNRRGRSSALLSEPLDEISPRAK